MKRETARKEFLKLKLSGYPYVECQILLQRAHGFEVSNITLKRWWKRFNLGDWNLRNTSRRPHRIHYKFSAEEIDTVIDLRKTLGYSTYQLKPLLEEKGISMSESMMKRVIKAVHLSRGNKMEGMRLKWVRFERDMPNSMWRLDGTQYNGRWVLPIEDDCSRYCVALGSMDHMTTANVIKLLEEAIAMHGKPRELLTDNGSEFGGNGKGDNDFDKWCEGEGITHIRSAIHKPTTVGKVSRLQYTMVYELPYCHNDFEYFRWRYNCHRPHRSLHGLTPNQVYFGWKRHKKYKEV